MIQLQVIDDKEIVNDKVQLNGSFITVQSDSIRIDHFIVVDDQTSMRPDILSYASGVPVDKILKFNQIFNPYSIKAGDVIAIPNEVSYDQYTETSSLKAMPNQQKKINTSAEILTKVKMKNTSASSSPSKKPKPSSNFSKSNDGILVF